MKHSGCLIVTYIIGFVQINTFWVLYSYTHFRCRAVIYIYLLLTIINKTSSTLLAKLMLAGKYQCKIEL